MENVPNYKFTGESSVMSLGAEMRGAESTDLSLFCGVGWRVARPSRRPRCPHPKPASPLNLASPPASACSSPPRRPVLDVHGRGQLRQQAVRRGDAGGLVLQSAATEGSVYVLVADWLDNKVNDEEMQAGGRGKSCATTAVGPALPHTRLSTPASTRLDSATTAPPTQPPSLPPLPLPPGHRQGVPRAVPPRLRAVPRAEEPQRRQDVHPGQGGCRGGGCNWFLVAGFWERSCVKLRA